MIGTANVIDRVPNRAGAWAAILYVAIAGNMFIALSPIFWGGFSHYLHFDDARIGNIMSSEFFGATAATVAGILYMHRERMNLRTVTFVALAAYGIGNYLTPLFFEHPQGLRVVRFVCGLSSGTTFLAAATAITALKDASRLIAVFYGAPYFTGTVFQPLMQVIFGKWGFETSFLLITAAVVGSVVVFPFFPKFAGQAAAAQDGVATDKPSLTLLLLLASGLLLQYIANSGVWLFFERLGTLSGHTEQTAANVVGLSTGMGLVGTGVAAVLAHKLKPLYGILIGTGIIIMSSIALHFSRALTVYAGSVATFNVMITFLTPFYFILLVKTFHPAKAVIVGNICLMLGFAFGPLLIGYTVKGNDFSASINVTIGLFLASIAFVFVYAIVAKRVQAASRD